MHTNSPNKEVYQFQINHHTSYIAQALTSEINLQEHQQILPAKLRRPRSAINEEADQVDSLRAKPSRFLLHEARILREALQGPLPNDPDDQ